MKMNMKRKKSVTRAYFGDNKACENESVQQSVQKTGLPPATLTLASNTDRAPNA
jgi:hypothetical protein